MPRGKGIRRAGVTAVSAVAVLSMAWSAAPLRASAAAYPALAGVNTVTTTTSGFATVQLLQPARVGFSHFFGPQDGPAGTGIQGPGRIIAMVLEQDGRAVMEALQISDCGTAACQGNGSFEFIETFTRHGQLNPGVYHLYVVADGGPVRATLSLQGIPGATTVSLTPSPDIVEQSLTPMTPSTGVADPPAYSAGGSGTIGAAGGLMFNSLALQVASFEGGYFGSCGGQGAAPPAYIAGCDYPPDANTVSDLASPFLICDPTGFCDPGYTIDAATQPSEFFGGGEMFVDPGQAGTWSQGGYFQGAAVLTSEAATGVWLSYVASPSADVRQASATPGPAQSATPSPTPTPAATVPANVNLPNTGAPDGASAGAGLLAAVVLSAAFALRRRRER